MSRLFVALGLGVALWLMPGLAAAQLSAEGQCPGADKQLVAYASETLTISGTPVSLTVSVYNPMTGGFRGSVPLVAAVTVVSGPLLGPITALDTGSAATLTSGMVYQLGQRFWICGRSISAVQMVAQGLASGIAQIVYYRSP